MSNKARLNLSTVLLLSLGVALSACGADFAGADFDEGFGDDGETSGGGSGSGDGDGEGTDGADEGEGPYFDLGGNTGDGDEGEEDVACTPDCGENGTCVELGDDSTTCECADGYEFGGAAGCIQCGLVDAELDIDVPVLEISVNLTVAGDQAPASEYDDANLYLENPRSGDRIWLGNSHDAELGALVVPGIYDLVYENETVGNTMPINTRAVLDTLDLQEDASLDVNLKAVMAQGDILLNDEAPPALEHEDGRIVFVDPDDGESTVVGNTHNGGWNAVLLSGRYDVYYELEDGGDLVPVNEHAKVDTVVILGAEDLTPIHIDASTLSGAVTINDETPPAVEHDDGNLLLHSVDGDRAVLGNTHDGSFEALVVDGNYDLHYALETGGTDVPRNTDGWIKAFNVAGDDDAAGIDIPMTQLSGAFEVNGGTAPPSEFDDGVFTLRGAGNDDSVALGNSHDGSFQIGVLPGEYDVYYSSETPGGTMPLNVGARVDNFTVDGDASRDLNVQAVVISGDLTIDGDVPPDSEYADGRIYLRKVGSDDSVLLGNTKDANYSAVVVPGTYEVHYVEETSGSGVPGNQDARLGALNVQGGMSYNIDVPTVSLAGEFSIGMNVPSPTPSNSASIYLRDGGDSILLGATHHGDYTSQSVAGSYGIYYRRDGAGTEVPANINGRIGCVTIE